MQPYRGIKKLVSYAAGFSLGKVVVGCLRGGGNFALHAVMSCVQTFLWPTDRQTQTSVRLSINLQSVCVCPFNFPSIDLFIHPSIHPFMHQSVRPSIHPSLIHPSFHLKPSIRRRLQVALLSINNPSIRLPI